MIACIFALVAALRIVSLAPSITEILYAIGAGHSVVGVDAFSNRPDQAKRLPRVGGMREISAERVLALHPDLVLGIPYERRVLDDLARSGVRSEVLTIDSLEDDYASIVRVGTLTGNERSARTVVAKIRSRIDTVSKTAMRARSLSAFVSIGAESLYTAAPGTYIDDLLRRANLRNVVTSRVTLWPKYSAEQLITDQPDVIVVPASDADRLNAPPWDRLEAIQRKHVVAIAEDDLLRAGPRVADVLEGIVRATRAWR